MKYITLNGVEICVATAAELEESGISLDEWHRLDEFGLVLLRPLQRKDALFAAGYDLQQVDFALPQDWVDDNRKGRGEFIPEDWVWDHSDASVFGKHLYVGGWMKRKSCRVLE